VRAPAASLSSPSGLTGTSLNCSVQDDGSLAIEFAVPATLSAREELEDGTVFQLDRTGTQTHTHRWRSLTSGSNPTCTSEGHIDRSWLDVKGVGLAYDFTVDVSATVNTGGDKDARTFGVSAAGDRALDFAEGDTSESMKLKWTSNVVRTVSLPDATRAVVALDAADQLVGYRIDSDGSWTEVLLGEGSWSVALRADNGSALATGVITATGVRMDRTVTNESKSDGVSCLPRAGEVRVEWNEIGPGNPAELVTGRAISTQFGGPGLPVVSETDGGETAQLTPLWCLE